jgi:predicted nucleotidyltransferase
VTWPTAPALSRDWTFDQVVAALARSRRVEAVVLIGSATGDPRPESDLDLLVILDPEAPRVGVGLTHVDGRLTDLVFVRADVLPALVEALRGGAPLEPEHARLAAWLSEGRVLHDRASLTTEAARLAKASRWRARAPTPADQYAIWFSINFNLRHTERMLASADRLYHDAIDVRFLYQLLDLLFGYFRLRGREARGEKEAIRYLGTHDPAYLALFQSCLHEPDRVHRVALYRQLAEATVAPVGPLWPPDATALSVEDATPERVAEALAFWNGLLGS